MIRSYRIVAAATCLCVLLNASFAIAQTPRHLLEEKTTLECINMPLGDLADHFSKTYGIPFEIAHGVNTKTIITVKANGKLKDILKQILTPLDLGYSVNEKRILIRPSRKSQLIQFLKLTSTLLWLRSVCAPIPWLLF